MKKIVLTILLGLSLFLPNLSLGAGRPTLYTEPDHCPPCRELEAQLRARFGERWRNYINVSRGSPVGSVPYIVDGNGQPMGQEQLFSYIAQAMRQPVNPGLVQLPGGQTPVGNPGRPGQPGRPSDNPPHPIQPVVIHCQPGKTADGKPSFDCYDSQNRKVVTIVAPAYDWMKTQYDKNHNTLFVYYSPNKQYPSGRINLYNPNPPSHNPPPSNNGGGGLSFAELQERFKQMSEKEIKDYLDHLPSGQLEQLYRDYQNIK